MKAISADFLRGWGCIAWAHCIKLGLMREFVVEWQSLRKTVVDE